MKTYLRASSMLFNTPLIVAPEVLDMAVRWANQVMNLNIINIGAQAADPRMWDDDGAHHSARMQLEEQRRASIAASAAWARRLPPTTTACSPTC